MRRWTSTAIIGGALIVLAFVAERFWTARAAWRDLLDLAGFGLFIVVVAFILVIVLVGTIAIPWRGYLFWKKTRRKPTI